MFYIRLVLFLIINFAGLALGGMFTSEGVSSAWYSDLNKAPWTPPGWVFGLAWTTIMICLAFFMSAMWSKMEIRKQMTGWFILQWLLNFIWNPIFFKYHFMGIGMIVIVGLLIIVCLLFSKAFFSKAKWLLIPYIAWLFIATTLNFYSWFFN